MLVCTADLALNATATSLAVTSPFSITKRFIFCSQTGSPTTFSTFSIFDPIVFFIAAVDGSIADVTPNAMRLGLDRTFLCGMA